MAALSSNLVGLCFIAAFVVIKYGHPLTYSNLQTGVDTCPPCVYIPHSYVHISTLGPLDRVVPVSSKYAFFWILSTPLPVLVTPVPLALSVWFGIPRERHSSLELLVIVAEDLDRSLCRK